MQKENWERALINFEYVINANHNNPFAYYYASKAAKKIGLLSKAHKYYHIYQEIRRTSVEWENLFQKFIMDSVEFSEI